MPEPVHGTLRVGQAASVSCDGCGAPIAATISHLSTQAEYTPPILYNRERLVDPGVRRDDGG